MTLELTPTTTTAVSEHDTRRAQQLIGSMPFGGSIDFRTLGRRDIEKVTVADLLDDVERLRDALIDIAAHHNVLQAENAAWARDVAAVRRVLGIEALIAVLAGNDAERRTVPA